MNFDAFIMFGWISVLLLAGAGLRAKIKIFQKALLPSSLIGGILGCILMNLGVIRIDESLLSQFVFHIFILSFIAIGLMGESKKNGSGKKKGSLFKNPVFKGSLWMALFFWMIYPLQGILGYFIMKVYGNFSGSGVNPLFGLLLPTAFANGPGQAVTAGTIFEQLGFEGAVPVAVAFAAIGFISCFAIGIPVANWGIRKGLAKSSGQLSDEFLRGIIDKNREKESAGDLTFHGANVETLAIHVAIIGAIYLVSYYFADTLAQFASPAVATAIMGSVYTFGLVFAKLTKVIMGKMNISHVMCPPIQKRIAGWTIDFMVLATVMSVKVTSLGAYLIPVLLICLAGTLMTALFSYYFGRRIGGENDFERSLVMYGVCTGTTNSGLILLRIIDPDFKTDTATEVAMHVLVGDALFGILIPILGLGPVILGWTVTTTLVVLAGFAVTYLVMKKIFKVWGKPTYSLFKHKTSENEQLENIA